MKSMTVIAIVLSVFLIQAAVAEDWKESVAKQYKDEFLKFAANMKKWFTSSPANNPKCVENAIKTIDSVSDFVIKEVDNCVNSANNRDEAEECAKKVKTVGILQIATINCSS